MRQNFGMPDGRLNPDVLETRGREVMDRAQAAWDSMPLKEKLASLRLLIKEKENDVERIWKSIELSVNKNPELLAEAFVGPNSSFRIARAELQSYRNELLKLGGKM